MKQRHLLLGAFGLSALLHALLLPPAVGLWQGNKVAPKAKPPEPKEVTIPLAEMIRVVQAAPESLPYARTTESQRSATAPERPDFQSDRDTLLTSPKPANPNGQGPSPTIDGSTNIGNEVEQREFRDAEFKEESPTPTGAESSPPTPQAEPSPPEEVTPPSAPAEAKQPPKEADIADTPPPTPKKMNERDKASEKPPPKKPRPPTPQAKPSKPGNVPSTVRPTKPAEQAYQPQTRKRTMNGEATRLGEAAFNTKKTIMGEYEKQVNDAIDREWRRAILMNRSFYTFAQVQVKFVVDANGKVTDLEVLDRNANAALTDITLGAIMQAPIPKMPKALVDLLEGGTLPLTIQFHMQ